MHNLNSPATDDNAIECEIQAKGKTAPRVTLKDLKANIANEYYFTAGDGAGHSVGGVVAGYKYPGPLDLLTFCVLVLRNGFTVTGESACVSPENFDPEIGRMIARQNAEQKIWPLMGYALKEQLVSVVANPPSDVPYSVTAQEMYEKYARQQEDVSDKLYPEWKSLSPEGQHFWLMKARNL